MKTITLEGARIFFTFYILLQMTFPSIAHLTALTRNKYDSCFTEDEMQLKIAIRSIVHTTLKKGILDLNYEALIRDQWRAHNLSNVLKAQIDNTVLQMQRETSWRKLLESLAYRDTANALAFDMSERVYRSKKIKKALENMTIDIWYNIGKSIELTAADAHQPTTLCLHTFLGPRYGQTITDAIVQDTALAFVTPSKESIAKTEITTNTSGLVSGAIILLFRRQLSSVAKRLGQRATATIISRLVSVMAGGISVILIAKDIWDLRYGMLPIVAEEMKSKNIEVVIKDELTKIIKREIDKQLETLSDNVSKRIINIWREFKLAHLKVLELINANPEFKKFISTVQLDQLARIDEVVAIILRRNDPTLINKLMENGAFYRAVVQLPNAGLQIAREKQSIELALSWWDVARSQIYEVVQLEIYKVSDPSSFTFKSLQNLLSFDDKIISYRFAEIPRKARNALMSLSHDYISRIVHGMSPQHLAILADYMIGLSTPTRQKLVEKIINEPELMNILAPTHVLWGILQSNNQLIAIEFMLRTDHLLNTETIYSDLNLVWQRHINPILIWSKYSLVIILSGIPLLIFTLIIQRIFSVPNRRKVL
ncbi:MAG: hypothetical protein HRT83_04400 [Hyphomicrobiaceae bacterium]|nr:hypothetical protein [Hyphomicrobiaceae bacterium]